jgi:hypothetical protein
MSYIEGESRNQSLLFPEILDDYITRDNLVRFMDAFVDGLHTTAAIGILANLSFRGGSRR